MLGEESFLINEQTTKPIYKNLFGCSLSLSISDLTQKQNLSVIITSNTNQALVLEDELSYLLGKENIWYFSPSQKYIDNWYFRDAVQNALEKRYQGMTVIVTVPVSYYKISYHDYLNDYKEDYYYDIEGHISYDVYKSKETNEEEKDNKESSSYSLITAIFKSDKELIEECVKMIISHYDRYYIEKDIWI